MAVATDAFGEVCGADDLLDVGTGPKSAACLRCRVTAGVHDSNAVPRFGIDRLGILSIALVQLEDVTGIHSLELIQTHDIPILTHRPTGHGDTKARLVSAQKTKPNDSPDRHRRRRHIARHARADAAAEHRRDSRRGRGRHSCRARHGTQLSVRAPDRGSAAVRHRRSSSATAPSSAAWTGRRSRNGCSIAESRVPC